MVRKEERKGRGERGERRDNRSRMMAKLRGGKGEGREEGPHGGPGAVGHKGFLWSQLAESTITKTFSQLEPFLGVSVACQVIFIYF